MPRPPDEPSTPGRGRERLTARPAVDDLTPTRPGATPVLAAPAADPGPGGFDGYRVVRVVGRGGMGLVYEAEQLDPPRAVALKVLVPALRADPSAVARFHTEVAIAARLHHTHIVPVLGAVAGPGGPAAYAMPLVRGVSLAAVARAARGEWPAGGPSPVADRAAALARADYPGYLRAAAEWLRQAAEAVAAAHAAGVVHRDVKPGNLLLEFGRDGRPHVWLHDFGLAVEAGAAGDDPPGVGTPGYRSPELAAGGPGGRQPAADVYGLGATLAALVALAPRTDDRPPVVGRAVPRELRRVVARATAPDPAARYPSAAELADDLGRFLAGRPVAAGRPAWGRRLALWAARHRRPLAAAASALLAAGLVAAVGLARAYRAERAAREHATAARRAVADYTLAIDDLLFATPGRLDDERALLEQAARVQELQLAVDPADPVAMRHLAHASWRLGRVYARAGRPYEAAGQARRAVALYAAVAAFEPEEPLHRLDVARAYSVLAAALRAADPADGRAALAADADALRTARRLAADFPDDVRVRDALATYLAVYGHAAAMAGRAAEAEGCYREALAGAEGNRAARPDLWRLASPAAHARGRLAGLLAAQGRAAEALAENAAALALLDGLLAHATAAGSDADRLEVLSFRLTRAETLAARGAWLLAAGADAAAVSADLTTAAGQLAADHPDRSAGAVASARLMAAWVAERAGRPAEATGAARLYESSLAALPAGAARAVALSRLSADGPGPRDPGRAESAAREAVTLAPADPCAWTALGVALYRLGRWAEAEAALARAAARPATRTVGLARAAAAARSGRVDEARRLLAEAGRARLPSELCTPEWEREARQALGEGDNTTEEKGFQD